VSSSGGTQPAGGAAICGPSAGGSLVELTLVLALLATVAAMSAPVLAASVDAGRARQAAQYVAAQCRGARMEAIARSANAAVAFDRAGTRWRMQRCIDGNGNGVRRTEISRGKDPCTSAPVDLAELFSGVTFSIDASLPDPDGGAGSADAVRFGASDLASFTASGTATAGTVFLRSAGGAQFAVRVAGATGRVRILRFDEGTKRWVEV
jgi:type II secretory pathway pseudopilin PulG